MFRPVKALSLCFVFEADFLNWYWEFLAMWIIIGDRGIFLMKLLGVNSQYSEQLADKR